MALVRSPVFLVPFVLLLSFSLFWFSDTIADPDLWGHIRFGEAIIRAGSVVQADIYSYRTSGQRWINHEWLAEVIFARLYNLSGPVNLVGFKLLLSMLLMACTGALPVNPYRADLVLFLLRTATVPRPEIREWVPVALMSLPGLLYLGLLMIGIAGLVASRCRRKPETIVIFAVAAVLFLKIVTAFASPRHAKVPAASGSSSRESSPGFRAGCKNTGPRAKGRSLLWAVSRHGTTRYSFSCPRTANNLDWNRNDRTS